MENMFNMDKMISRGLITKEGDGIYHRPLSFILNHPPR